MNSVRPHGAHQPLARNRDDISVAVIFFQVTYPKLSVFMF
jgi:hypothetical protein